ncbi:MAG: acyl-CoA thioesterase-1 [Flavobacteriales bacterium]|jgi:acyl-CoA thioesterase-1
MNLQASTELDQKKVIIVMGDSLSAGYGMDELDGWVSLLGEKVDSEANDFRVVNSSVSGATTMAGLQRLPATLEQHQPAVVIIELGGNDGLQGKPLKYIKAKLTQLISLSKGSGAKVVLLGVRIPPNLGPAYTEPFFKQYAQLAQEYDLAYVPFLLEGIANKPELMQLDGIHPTAKAQGMILDNVWPVLESVLEPVLELKLDK